MLRRPAFNETQRVETTLGPRSTRSRPVASAVAVYGRLTRKPALARRTSGFPRALSLAAAANVAVTASGLPSSSVHVRAAPLHAPLQPLNVPPEPACAVSVTLAPGR